MSPRVAVIAEAGQCKGSVTYGTRAIHEAAAAGCWGLKVQLLRPETIAAAHAPVYWAEDRPGITSQRDSFAAAGCLPYDHIGMLVDYAHHVGLELVASPFDLEALAAMDDAGMRLAKIASGDLTNEELVLEAHRRFPGRVVLSTGAADLAEIERAIGWCERNPFAVLACTLAYPTKATDANIARIYSLFAMRERVEGTWRLGYSDHTFGVTSAAIAVGAGADVLEKHFTLDPHDDTVPDNAFALGPVEMSSYVAQAQLAALMLGNPSLRPSEVERAAGMGARRALYATTDLPVGHFITEADVVALRPYLREGFSPAERNEVVGRYTQRPVAAGAAVLRDDIS